MHEFYRMKVKHVGKYHRIPQYVVDKITLNTTFTQGNLQCLLVAYPESKNIYGIGRPIICTLEAYKDYST